jgi:hypothetical protein
LFSRNTAILDQHELKVKYNGRLVDAGSIDWNNVNMGAISFVQAPGPNNVLGKVKFVYPNPYSVYMHDTIKVGLFDKEERSEGHNCPRVGNPGKIAAVVLAADQNMPQADVDKLLSTGYNSSINITHHVPVHTSYFTAVVDDQGKVETFADIYKLDPAVRCGDHGQGAKARSGRRQCRSQAEAAKAEQCIAQRLGSRHCHLQLTRPRQRSRLATYSCILVHYPCARGASFARLKAWLGTEGKRASVQSQFTVGINVEGKGDRLVVKAEDALIAALKVKAERPDALITYVRRLNRRGDQRHPPHKLAENLT